MLAFIRDNLANILVLSVIAAMVAAALFLVRRARKKALKEGGCPGGCCGCPGAKNCEGRH